MPEKIPRPDLAVEIDDAPPFETLVAVGEWTDQTEKTLLALVEADRDDMYMTYLMYKESGLIDERSEYERKLHEWLKVNLNVVEVLTSEQAMKMIEENEAKNKK